MCHGPFGPGPCRAVKRFLLVQYAASQLNLSPVAFQPGVGPMCQGPLGLGPCHMVAFYIASQQVAEQEYPLQQVENMPGFCYGPLGPGPCAAIRQYLMQAEVGSPSLQQFNPRQVELIDSPNSTGGPLCTGPSGPMPCAIVAQLSIDHPNRVLPPPGSFGIDPNLEPTTVARACAQRAGLDVAAFAVCTGRRVVLPRSQQAVLDCAVKTRDSRSFASCAAPNLGIKLSDDQRRVTECAMRSNGDASRFAACAGPAFAARALGDNERDVLKCAAAANGGAEAFARCAAPRMLERNQHAVLNCALSTDSAVSFATCAAPNVGVKMSDDQRILANCAMKAKGTRDDFLSCAGGAYLNKSLGPNEQAVLSCAANASGDGGKFASCAASRLMGDKISREQQIALQCAAQARGDLAGMATCAGANMFGMQLNPEQQIAVQCVASTGGQPHAAAGCIASRLTARELTKCMTDGIGGKGCFGDTHDLVGKDGWLRRSMGQIAGGPNSVINNPDQIWGGDNSFVRNPHQIFGGRNSFVRNPSQIWGGPNSVFNNPGQLLPQPKPLQIGTVAGRRICLPWC